MRKKRARRRDSVSGSPASQTPRDGMTVKLVGIDEVLEHPRNVRRHNSENMSVIKHSLSRFGQQTPIVVNSHGYCLKGNGTLRAARELEWESIYVVTVEMDEDSEEAYAIIDNRSSDLSNFDWPALIETMERLDESEAMSIEDLGFSEYEARALLGATAWEPSGKGGESESKFTYSFTEEQADLFNAARDLYVIKTGTKVSPKEAVYRIVEAWYAQNQSDDDND